MSIKFKSVCGCHEFRPFGSNIHAHSDQSLDGGSSVAKIVKKAKELGMQHLVLTEHGNINSAASLAMSASKAGMSFSNGIEVYLENPLKEEGTKESYVHLSVLFKTYKAYEYFCRLTPVMESRAVIKFGERKPIIRWDELEEIGPEIVIGSGCLVGFIQKFVLSGKPELAERAYQMARSIVRPGCFFVEFFPHEVTHNWQRPKKDKSGSVTEEGKFVANECLPGETHGDIQRNSNLFVMAMAERYGDPIVISEDSHFATPNQKLVQDARLGNGQESWKFYTSYHMRTPAECFEDIRHIYDVNFKRMDQFIDNSYALADVLKDYKFKSFKDRWVLPEFEGSSKKHLLELINKHGRLPKDPAVRQQYIERIQYEVSVLTKNKVGDLLPYIFQVEEVADWCKNNDVLMNLRGSAGGSLLLYLIGASVTDPIRYNLPFERFITTGRIDSGSLPDADADLSNKTKVVAHFKQKLGDRIVPLSINTNLKLKNSIKDSERSILGRVRPETERMCTTFPGIPQGPTEEQWLFGYQDKETETWVPGFWEQNAAIRAYAEENPEIWDVVKECLGVMRNKGSHACGFLITPEPVQNYFPVAWVGLKDSGQMCTAFDPKSLEYAGGVKYDFLGVATLNTIQVASKLIRERHGINLEWQEYPHDDEVYDEVFAAGQTMGIFQYNTAAVKPFLKKIKPRNVQDLSAITALVRPGALDAPAPDFSDRTCAEYYVAVAMGEKPYYLHADLEPILQETNGVMLYQEQTLQIFRDLGGHTYETAEAVRRAISKKDKDTLSLHGGNLKKSLIERGWKESQADALFNQILASARYSFNKSHSMSYAIVGYNTAYLKKNYPLEFWAAELTTFSDKEDKLKAYLTEIGQLILAPSLSHSHAVDWKIEDTKIRAPLSIVKGLGPSATEAIIAGAPYTSVADLVARVDARAVNRGVFLKLVWAGLFDDLNIPHIDMVKEYWKLKKIRDAIPEEAFDAEPIRVFQRRSELNPICKEQLWEFVTPKLEAKGWLKMSRKSTPMFRGNTPLLASSFYALRAIEANMHQHTMCILAFFKSAGWETTKNGRKLMKLYFSDGVTEFDGVDWNATEAPKLKPNSLVLITGKMKLGYKIPLSISVYGIETIQEMT